MCDLYFVGDICADSYKKASEGKFTKSYLYHTLKNGYTIGNLEAPVLHENLVENKNKFSLINKNDLSGYFDFCNLVTLANNHIFDQGTAGFVSTTNWLDANSIDYIGAGSNLFNARKPFIKDFNGCRVAFLAYNCFSTNSSHYADLSQPGTSPLIFNFVQSDVKRLKGKVDKVLVLVHWGIENEFQPTVEQTSFARKLIDFGVDGIIGTHPHVIQSYEYYKGKPIYYSLGNFIFNDFRIDENQNYYQTKLNKEGLIVKCFIDKNKNLNFSEHFIKFDEHYNPVFTEKTITPVRKNNDDLKKYTSQVDYKNSLNDLSLHLRFNGKSMQVVYESKPINGYAILKYETMKSKVKRLIVHSLRKLL
ncbi:CapA family protein [Vibrio sp. 1865]|uniref:CapA family protein n=1 Tax=unclassified Vibrio TaxID=2614977 RepID=UPI0029648246|nr:MULTISPECIES: CapA family protein [unclassified Vibrio]MDW2092049.1 CapA family protein [Vibrio sp. 1866]MDW3102124.1 CapA family protein [Vibrio sp. 1874]MDW3199808.1 CapA family protein [Vibrio sp. 1865]